MKEHPTFSGWVGPDDKNGYEVEVRRLEDDGKYLWRFKRGPLTRMEFILDDMDMDILAGMRATARRGY